MDAEATTRLLKLRSQLTRNPYGNDTINAWTEALDDVTEHDATRAMRAITANGTTSVGIPELRNWLRDEKRRDAMTASGTPPPRDTGCRCLPPQHGLPHGAICDMHRQTGLDAIARIRAQRKPR